MEIINEKSLKVSCDSMAAVGIGSGEELLKIAEAYRTAEFAANVSGQEGRVILYDELGFEMLLGNIQPDVAKSYTEKTISGLNQEEIKILKVYFEQEMSLQKACKVLFMHKNTLQNKLNKIHHICGYNPRIFRDAVVLYSAIKLRLCL